MSDRSDSVNPARARSARLRLGVITAYIIAGGVLFQQTHGEPLTGPPSLLPFLLLLIPLVVLLIPYFRPEVDDAAPEHATSDETQGSDWEWLLAAVGFLPPAFKFSLIQLGLLTLASLLIYYVLRQIPILDATAGASFRLLYWCWLLAIASYAAAVLDWRPGQVKSWLVASRRHLQARDRRLIVAVAGIVLGAAMLRLWQIGTIPYVLAGDEGAQGLEAVKVLNGEMRNPFSTGWLGVPSMSFFFNSWSIRWLGQTVTALRVPWALVGTATVFFTFLYARQLKGARFGLLAAALLAVYHYHIHFSRLGSNQIADPFFAVLALYFLQRALDNGRRFDWLMTGVVSGLAFYFYAGARFTPVVVVAVLGYYLTFERQVFLRKHGAGIVLAVVTFLLVAAPMIQYSVRFPNEFNARINQVGIIQSGWLEREVVIRGESVATILFDQFQRAALAFNYYPDRTVWYGLREPLLDPWFGTLFLLSLGFVTVRTFLGAKRDARFAPMVAWWWGGVLLGGMLTESPPSSQRLVTLTVPTCFMLAVMIWELVDLARAAFGRGHGRWPPHPWIAGFAAVIFAYGSLSLYFAEYTPQRIYGGPQALIAMEVAPLLQAYDASYTHYYVGAPRMYWGFATLPYLLPDRVARDILDPLTAPIARNEDEAANGFIFVFLPERENELPFVTATYPDGEQRRVSGENGEGLALVYIVPPE